MARDCKNEQHLIAVHDASQRIDHEHAVAVPVEREPHLRSHAGHRQLQ